MKRLTDKDWHTTKFMGLNEREVLHRLWELENEIEEYKNKQIDELMQEQEKLKQQIQKGQIYSTLGMAGVEVWQKFQKK